MKTRSNIVSAAVLGSVLLFQAGSAQALVSSTQLREAKLCTQHFPKNERIHGIPTHLLAAISSTESGRWNDELGLALPWPWTINANGKGYYLNSKAEALAKVRSLKAQGITSIDVGCMQVNLKHHPTAFSSLEQAFDPQANIAYAAKFLRRNYDEQKSWVKATAAYHSKTPYYGNKYLALIEKNWSRLVGKIRTARADQGLSAGEYAMNVSQRDDEQQFASLAKEFASTTIPLRDVDKLGFSQPSHPISKQKSMRVIKVRDVENNKTSNNVMVIRPQVSNASATVRESGNQAVSAKSATASLFVSQYDGPSKSVTSSNASAKTGSARPAPKFIFVD